MRIIYERKFLRDLQKIKDQKILNRIQSKIEEIEKIIEGHPDNGNLPVIPGMTKL